VKTLAIVLLIGLTVLNYLSVRAGNVFQLLATAMKTLAIALLIGGILFSGKGSGSNFITTAPGFQPWTWLAFTSFMAATSGALASYDGWYNVNMVAGRSRIPGAT
jgi:APA family basic amino acid/polyamine antiporter